MKKNKGVLIGLVLASVFWLALAGLDFFVAIIGVIPGFGDALVSLSSLIENFLQGIATVIIAGLSYMLGAKK